MPFIHAIMKTQDKQKLTNVDRVGESINLLLHVVVNCKTVLKENLPLG
jgi:hypothetical protein